MRRTGGILVAVVVVAVAAVAACNGGDAELCADGFDTPVTLVNAAASVGMGGDAFTLVYAGRQSGQLVFERRDFDGNVVLAEQELTADGYDPSTVRFSGSGDYVSWIEGAVTPRELRVGRISADGALADVATVATAGPEGPPHSIALADAGPGAVAVLWALSPDLSLTIVTAGQAAPAMRVASLTPARMITAAGELAIGRGDAQGAVLERRAFDGTPLAPPLEVIPAVPSFSSMCWDGGGYRVVADSVAVAYARTDGTTVSTARSVTSDDVGFPDIACRDDGGLSVLTWTSVLAREPGGNVAATHVMFRSLDSDGTPLGRETPITTRTDALNIEPRLHVGRDGSVVAAWDEYSTDAPQGIRLVAARCTP